MGVGRGQETNLLTPKSDELFACQRVSRHGSRAVKILINASWLITPVMLVLKLNYECRSVMVVSLKIRHEPPPPQPLYRRSRVIILFKTLFQLPRKSLLQ